MKATRELSEEELHAQSLRLQRSQFFTREEAAHTMTAWLDQFVSGNLALFDAMPHVLKTILLQAASVELLVQADQKMDDGDNLIKKAEQIKERLEKLDPKSEEFGKLLIDLQETLATGNQLRATINLSTIQENNALASRTLKDAHAAVADAKERYSLFSTRVKIRVWLGRVIMIVVAFVIAYLIDFAAQRMQTQWPATNDSLLVFTGIFLVGVIFVDPLNGWITRRIYLRVVRSAEVTIREEIAKMSERRSQLIDSTAAELRRVIAIPNLSPDIRVVFEEVLATLT